MFNVLEIKAEQIVGKDYQVLSKFLKKQYNKLILVNHPDKGGDKNRFDQIYKAYQELKKYIEPLELGNPCVKVSVGAESNGRLTAREFHYRKKLFDTLGIGEEAIGKDFDKLISILKKNDRSFEEDFKYCFLRDALSNLSRLLNPGELNKRLSKPSMRLFLYISPLEEKRSLIEEDKKELALRFIERKNALLSNTQRIKMYLLFSSTWITTAYFYFSYFLMMPSNNAFINPYLLLVIPLSVVMKNVLDLLEMHYAKKYEDSKISTDEFISKMHYIQSSRKLFVFYPLSAFSIYSLIAYFTSNNLTVGIVIFGTLLSLTLLITEVIAPVFSKGCEIYAERHTKDLLEEDPRNRVQKETDLLGWYDPRKLLMPIVMPLVKKCFAEVASEFAERNFDEVKTDMSDVNAEGLSKPKGIEFAQQPV
ncbi:molecular chaperone DnaJ [Wolbachia endosymbiont of Drosophila tsacasi]